MTLPDPAIFKAYDVRGLYGSELDEASAELIGRSFAQVIAEVANGTKHLEIGDPRLTSNPAAKEVVARPAMGGAINTHPLNTAPLNFWRPAQIVVLTRRATGDPDMLIPAVDILAEALAWWERTLPAGV